MMANHLLVCILFLSNCIALSCCTCEINFDNKLQIKGFNTLEYTTGDLLLCSNIYLNKTNQFTNEFHSKQSNINSLYINDSYIPEIYEKTFEKYEFFENLILTYNQIQTIGQNVFFNWKNLTYLDLSHNNLTSFNFVLPSNISIMILSHNNISTVTELDGYSSLNRLDLSNNSILGEVNLKSFINLLYLNLSHNNVTSLKHIPALETLDLSYNNISMIDFANKTNLAANGKDFFSTIKTIDLKNNFITDINEHSLKHLAILETLNLSHNAIDTIHPGAFDDLINLKVLDLSFNELYEIPTGLFYHQANLKSLFIATNYINNFEYGTFTGLTSLELLDVTDNNINNLNAIHPLASLKELRIKYNYVYEINVDQIIRHFKVLKKLAYSFPGLTCKEMLLTILKLDSVRIEVEKGDYFYNENINGLYCYTTSYFRQGDDEYRMIHIGSYFSRISIVLIVIICILISIVMLTSFTLYRIYMKHRTQTKIDSNLYTCSLKLLNENDILD